MNFGIRRLGRRNPGLTERRPLGTIRHRFFIQGRAMSRISNLVPVGLLASAFVFPGCQTHSGRLAGVGAATGAVAGAALGSRGGDALPGAVIGSVVGATAGAAVGGEMDESEARNAALIEQRMGRRIQGVATTEQVIAMSQAGLSDSVIATHIRNHGVLAPPRVDELIRMRNAGVSDVAIQAMQDSAAAPPQVVIREPPPRTVIVEESYCAPPIIYARRPHYHHRRHHHHGVSWGFHYRH